MFEVASIARLGLRRRTIAGFGTLAFGLLFHFAVTSPHALARADTPRGIQRLHHVFGRSFSQTGLLFGDGPPESLFGNAFTGTPVPPAGPPGKGSAGQDALSAATDSGSKAIADPALLQALQAALHEKRDAEYIARLRRFRRMLAPIYCPPLPSYSLKNLTALSDSERYIASCHERKQLQARCVIPRSLFEPMHCPEKYEWEVSEQWQESERKWLSERTQKR